MRKSIETGEPIKVDMEKEKAIFDTYLSIPLETMKPQEKDVKEILSNCIVEMRNLCKYKK